MQGLEHSTQHLRLKVLHIPKRQVGGSVARDAEELAKPTRAAIFAYSAPVISIFSNSMPLSISSWPCCWPCSCCWTCTAVCLLGHVRVLWPAPPQIWHAAFTVAARNTCTTQACPGAWALTLLSPHRTHVTEKKPPSASSEQRLDNPICTAITVQVPGNAPGRAQQATIPASSDAHTLHVCMLSHYNGTQQ